jgi:phosphoglycolate phosphatase-like HAD superfamily hydrolase
MNTDTIFLFDIDGTLITTGEIGRRAFIEAFHELTGVADAFDGYSFGGRTDRAIARAGLQAAQLVDSEDAIDGILSQYLLRLEITLADSPEFAVLPGVHTAIEALASRNASLGIGTGNVEKGARVKLERADLNRWFGFGGFGCDAEDRAELLLAGAKRGAHRLNRPLDSCRVIVIGDTLRDVSAAHAIGATCMAVGTGGVSRTEFEHAGAEWFFHTLEEPDALHILLGLANPNE